MVAFDATESLTPFRDPRGSGEYGAILFDCTQLRQVDPRWFDPDEGSTAFFPIRSGLLYAFRVRGWSEGGTGPYSAPAVVYTGRRRAVR